MTNMAVETVARAICVAAGNDNPSALLGMDDPDSTVWKEFIPEARAAIKAHLQALREPSEGMVTMALNALGDAAADLSHNDIAWAWRAGIDAALSETE